LLFEFFKIQLQSYFIDFALKQLYYKKASFQLFTAKLLLKSQNFYMYITFLCDAKKFALDFIINKTLPLYFKG